MIHACQYDPRNDCAACRSEEDTMTWDIEDFEDEDPYTDAEEN